MVKIAHFRGLCAAILSHKSSITPQNGPKSVSGFAFSNAKYHVRNVVFYTFESGIRRMEPTEIMRLIGSIDTMN